MTPLVRLEVRMEGATWDLEIEGMVTWAMIKGPRKVV